MWCAASSFFKRTFSIILLPYFGNEPPSPFQLRSAVPNFPRWRIEETPFWKIFKNTNLFFILQMVSTTQRAVLNSIRMEKATQKQTHQGLITKNWILTKCNLKSISFFFFSIGLLKLLSGNYFMWRNGSAPQILFYLLTGFIIMKYTHTCCKLIFTQVPVPIVWYSHRLESTLSKIK